MLATTAAHSWIFPFLSDRNNKPTAKASHHCQICGAAQVWPFQLLWWFRLRNESPQLGKPIKTISFIR
jgi:hypothetical protein